MRSRCCPRHLLALVLWRYPAAYQGQMKTGLELLMRPPPFAEAMARLRQAREHRQAFHAFQVLEASDNGGVH